MKKIIIGLVIFVGIGVSACDAPVKIRAKIVSTKSINPNIRNRPSPVEIRIYHLKDETKFNRAGYFQLLKRDKKILGSQLIRKETMVVRPGQTVPYRTDTSKEMKYLAVFAAFRVSKGKQWKAIKRVSAVHWEYVTITIHKNHITIENK